MQLAMPLINSVYNKVQNIQGQLSYLVKQFKYGRLVTLKTNSKKVQDFVLGRKNLQRRQNYFSW